MPPETTFQQYKKWWRLQAKIAKKIDISNPHLELTSEIEQLLLSDKYVVQIREFRDTPSNALGIQFSSFLRDEGFGSVKKREKLLKDIRKPPVLPKAPKYITDTRLQNFFIKNCQRLGIKISEEHFSWMIENNLILPFGKKKELISGLRFPGYHQFQIFTLYELQELRLKSLEFPKKLFNETFKIKSWQEMLLLSWQRLFQKSEKLNSLIRVLILIESYLRKFIEDSELYKDSLIKSGVKPNQAETFRIAKLHIFWQQEGPFYAKAVQERYPDWSLKELNSWREDLIHTVTDTDPMWFLWPRYETLKKTIPWKMWRHISFIRLSHDFYDMIRLLNTHIGFLGGRKFKDLREAYGAKYNGKDYISCLFCNADVVYKGIGRKPIICNKKECRDSLKRLDVSKLRAKKKTIG